MWPLNGRPDDETKQSMTLKSTISDIFTVFHKNAKHRFLNLYIFYACPFPSSGIGLSVSSPSSPSHSDAATALSEHERSDADPLVAWRHFQRMRATVVANSTAAHSSASTSSSSSSSSLPSYPTPELDALAAAFAAYSAIAHAAAAAYQLYPNRAAVTSSSSSSSSLSRDSDAGAPMPGDVVAAIAAAVGACGAMVGGAASANANANANANSEASSVSLVFETSSLAAASSAFISNAAVSTRRALDVHALLDATFEGSLSSSSSSSSPASTLPATEPLALAWVATAALLLRLVASEARLTRHLVPVRAASGVRHVWSKMRGNTSH